MRITTQSIYFFDGHGHKELGSLGKAILILMEMDTDMETGACLKGQTDHWSGLFAKSSEMKTLSLLYNTHWKVNKRMTNCFGLMHLD